MSSKHILTIDGGGTSSIFSYHVVQRVYRLPHVRVDLVMGVSAGAVIGALFATGLIDQVCDDVLYTYIKHVFYQRNTQCILFAPVYDGRCKKQFLTHVFGSMTFGDVRLPMAIIVDRLHKGPEVCYSWDPAYSSMLLVDLLDATTAIPLMFPTISIDNDQFIDGGTVCRSPIGPAYLAGQERFPGCALVMLSVGTTTLENHSIPSVVDGKTMGLLEYVGNGYPLRLVQNGALLFNRMSIRAMRERFLRIDCHLTVPMDDLVVIRQCQALATQSWATTAVAIAKLLCTVTNH